MSETASPRFLLGVVLVALVIVGVALWIIAPSWSDEAADASAFDSEPTGKPARDPASAPKRPSRKPLIKRPMRPGSNDDARAPGEGGARAAEGPPAGERKPAARYKVTTQAADRR